MKGTTIPRRIGPSATPERKFMARRDVAAAPNTERMGLLPRTSRQRPGFVVCVQRKNEESRRSEASAGRKGRCPRAVRPQGIAHTHLLVANLFGAGDGSGAQINRRSAVLRFADTRACRHERLRE